MKAAESFFSYVSDTVRVYRVAPPGLRRGFWKLFCLQTVTAILESSTIIVIAFFIGSVSSPDSLRGGRFFQWLFTLLPGSWVIRLQGERSLACAMCLAVVLFIGVKNLMTGFTMARTTFFSERLGLFISKETLTRYFYKSYFWHISAESGDVLARLNNRYQLSSMIAAILQFSGYAICCLFMLTSLLVFEPWLTLILAGTFALVSFVTYRGVKRRIDRAGTALGELSARESRSFAMATRGIREIIIYRKQEAFLHAILDTVRAEMPYKSFLTFAGSLPAWLLEVAGFVVILGVMVGLAYAGKPMHEIVTTVSLLFLSAWRLLPALSRCMGLMVAIRGQRPMALSCLELLEGFASGHRDETVAPDAAFRFGRSIELRGVTFRYPGAPESCLHGISIDLNKGDCIGIIGASGSGKSTLALILAGLLEPESGTMLVDGIELDRMRRFAFREKVGLVPQNPLLLPGTVADNVALSKWGESYDLEKIAEACAEAAMDFLADDARGVELPIGDGGQGLSGGQAQRVAIARALFTNPEVLIMDEATSSLDQASENIIASTLRRFKGRVTTVIIAHRLTTVEQCDRLIWLQDGRVIAEGPPSDLLPKYGKSIRATHSAEARAAI
jgi:ABC-type multidrug transport system fused ATPase/permease subunit